MTANYSLCSPQIISVGANLLLFVFMGWSIGANVDSTGR
jgi:hypothetical protein